MVGISNKNKFGECIHEAELDPWAFGERQLRRRQFGTEVLRCHVSGGHLMREVSQGSFDQTC